MTRPKSTSAGSLHRAAALLDALAAHPSGEATVGELARQSRLPRTTVYRVVEQLTALHWVDLDKRTRKISVGQKFAAFARAQLSPTRLAKVAALELTVLAHDLKQTIYLDVRADVDLVCIARYDGGPKSETEFGYAGMRVPFGVTPATMAMLARMTPVRAQKIIAANGPRYNA